MQERKGGGVALFIRNTIPIFLIVSASHESGTFKLLDTASNEGEKGCRLVWSATVQVVRTKIKGNIPALWGGSNASSLVEDDRGKAQVFSNYYYTGQRKNDIGKSTGPNELHPRSTEKFEKADALSRLIENQKQESEDSIIATISLEEDIQQLLQVTIKSPPLSTEDVKRHTQENDKLRRIVSYL
ncbi:unnamed protein product [Schistosoma curassoni]|uniref:Reverse transcriptase domain-containing protein n=1 Tax=Schistosoma curassoni TaxID=6186 RepID=A0A183JWL8_9TREM|nr:unnamed protein product [Schistosoma curassoni]